MSVKPRVRVLCLPDIDRAIGGVKQLYRHVEHLVALGWDAAIVTQEEGFRPSWFDSLRHHFHFIGVRALMSLIPMKPFCCSQKLI